MSPFPRHGKLGGRVTNAFSTLHDIRRPKCIDTPFVQVDDLLWHVSHETSLYSIKLRLQPLGRRGGGVRRFLGERCNDGATAMPSMIPSDRLFIPFPLLRVERGDLEPQPETHFPSSMFPADS